MKCSNYFSGFRSFSKLPFTKINATCALKTFGVKEVFTTGTEFDKITAEGPIGVGKILHKAVVKVTKDGNEGSAATRVELILFSAGFQKQILIDRPSFHLH